MPISQVASLQNKGRGSICSDSKIVDVEGYVNQYAGYGIARVSQIPQIIKLHHNVHLFYFYGTKKLLAMPLKSA